MERVKQWKDTSSRARRATLNLSRVSSPTVSDSASEADVKYIIPGRRSPSTELKGPTIPVNASVDAHTDSGYASATKKFKRARNIVPTVNDSEGIQQRPEPLDPLGKMTSVASNKATMPSNTSFDDDGTVYSDASSMNIRKKDVYIFELAGDLYNGSCITKELQDSTTKRLLSALPNLLKAFALKLGYNAPAQAYREIMHFVHKYLLWVSL